VHPGEIDSAGNTPEMAGVKPRVEFFDHGTNQKKASIRTHINTDCSNHAAKAAFRKGRHFKQISIRLKGRPLLLLLSLDSSDSGREFD
jgi:hypothetical protein